MNLTIVIPNIMCFAFALLLFCYTGSMVLDQAYNLQQQAYNINWYDYTTSEKKMLVLLMARTLRPCGFSALGYYYCNNAIFTSVISANFEFFFFFWKILIFLGLQIMSNVFSSFAFLRNVVGWIHPLTGRGNADRVDCRLILSQRNIVFYSFFVIH